MFISNLKICLKSYSCVMYGKSAKFTFSHDIREDDQTEFRIDQMNKNIRGVISTMLSFKGIAEGKECQIRLIDYSLERGEAYFTYLFDFDTEKAYCEFLNVVFNEDVDNK